MPVLWDQGESRCFRVPRRPERTIRAENVQAAPRRSEAPVQEVQRFVSAATWKPGNSDDLVGAKLQRKVDDFPTGETFGPH